MQMIELQTSIDNLKTAYKNLLQNAYYKDTKHIDTYTITNQQEELNELFNSWYNIILKTTDENEKEEKMQDLKKIVDMLIEYMNQENQNASVLHENMKRIINYLRIFIEKGKLPPVEFIEYYTKKRKFIDPQDIDMLLSTFNSILSDNNKDIVNVAIELIKYSSMALAKTSDCITCTPTTSLARIINKIKSSKLDESGKIALINAFTNHIKIHLEKKEEESKILYGIFDMMETILTYIELDPENSEKYIDFSINHTSIDNYPEIIKFLKPKNGQKCDFDQKTNSIFQAHEIIKKEYANILYVVQNYLLACHFISEESLTEKFTNVAQIINMARSIEEANLIVNIIIDNPDFEDKEIKALVERTITSTAACKRDEGTYSIIFEISSMLTELEEKATNEEEKARYNQIFKTCIALFENSNVDSTEKQKKLRNIAKIIYEGKWFNAILLELVINHIIQENVSDETVINGTTFNKRVNYGIWNLIENSDLFEIENLEYLIEHLIEDGMLTLYLVKSSIKEEITGVCSFAAFSDYFEEIKDKNDSRAYIIGSEQIVNPTAEHSFIGGTNQYDTAEVTVCYHLRGRNKTNKEDKVSGKPHKVRKLLIINLNNNEEG